MKEQYLSKYQEIGKRIAYYRKKREMTQAMLGKKIKYNTQFISRIEGDYDSLYVRPYPWSVQSLDLLFSIADALQVDLPIFFLTLSEENFEKYRKDKPIIN